MNDILPVLSGMSLCYSNILFQFIDINSDIMIRLLRIDAGKDLIGFLLKAEDARMKEFEPVYRHAPPTGIEPVANCLEGNCSIL